MKHINVLTKKKSEQVIQVLQKFQETEDVKEKQNNTVELSRCSYKSSKSKKSQDEEVNKVDDIIIASNMDNVEEPSMYEDAIEKSTPIMNSTMKHSSDKQLNVTVVLERLPQIKLNETVVIQKKKSHTESKKSTSIEKTLQNSNRQSKKEIMESDNCNGLITDDESSPERKTSVYHVNKKKMKSLPSSDDDEIPNTPMKTRFQNVSAQEKSKATYKSSALFNPYGKESVKKRVEAFEQVVMQSPKSVDVDAASRLTRSKTRAMNTMNTENKEKNVKQLLARKSLVKAKKISLAKHVKDTEELKEVKAVVSGYILQLLYKFNFYNFFYCDILLTTINLFFSEQSHCHDARTNQ